MFNSAEGHQGVPTGNALVSPFAFHPGTAVVELKKIFTDLFHESMRGETCPASDSHSCITSVPLLGSGG